MFYEHFYLHLAQLKFTEQYALNNFSKYISKRRPKGISNTFERLKCFTDLQSLNVVLSMMSSLNDYEVLLSTFLSVTGKAHNYTIVLSE